MSFLRDFRNRDLIAGNLALLNGFFAEHAALFDWYEPDGGCIAFPRYRGEEGVEEFRARLVEEAGLLLAPAGIFHSELGPTPEGRFRIGFGRASLEAALEALRGYLA